jgi:hypothetical protein
MMEYWNISTIVRENHLHYLIVFSGWMGNHNPLFLKPVPVITILKWSSCFVKPSLAAFLKGLSHIKSSLCSGKIIHRP